MPNAAAMFVPNSEINEFSLRRPRAMRIKARIPVILIDDVGRELDAIIGNFSKDGFMAECEVRLPVHSVVETTHPHLGPIRAEVRWTDGWRFGAMILPKP